MRHATRFAPSALLALGALLVLLAPATARAQGPAGAPPLPTAPSPATIAPAPPPGALPAPPPSTAPALPPGAVTLAPVAQPAPCPVPTEPRSASMMIGGIVMTAVGGALLHLAALYPVLHENNGCSSCSTRGVSGGLALGGAVAVVVGIPLLVYGTKHVPVRPGAAGGPGGAGWVWTF